MSLLRVAIVAPVDELSPLAERVAVEVLAAFAAQEPVAAGDEHVRDRAHHADLAARGLRRRRSRLCASEGEGDELALCFLILRIFGVFGGS